MRSFFLHTESYHDEQRHRRGDPHLRQQWCLGHLQELEVLVIGHEQEGRGARMNRRLTQPTWRWHCSKTSIPNGASTHRKRAARRNYKPIKDRPTKPNATEKSTRKPLPGSIPDQARTSGAMATPGTRGSETPLQPPASQP
jgi:hypothetical protein